ncbi:MAG: hypothetical protein B0D82_00545, partial [Candidatus Sedimenticola endophacoides]
GGHVIGLHSHTHPTALARLDRAEQFSQYRENQAILERILGERPTTMSHPCNSYSAETLELLQRLGIDLGFCADMSRGMLSRLEHPREDHANIVDRLERGG